MSYLNNVEVANPEMHNRSKWEQLPEGVRKQRIEAMKAELLRLSDCVDIWLPAMEQVSSSSYRVLIDISREIRGIPMPVDQRKVDAAKKMLHDVAKDQAENFEGPTVNLDD